MAYLNIGIDLGIKAPSVAQIRNDKGTKLGQNYSLPITKESFDNLLAQAKTYASNGDKIRIVIEPTGMSWLPVALYGKTHDCEVVRVKAHKVHDLRKFYARNKKSDKIDVKTLAMMPVVDQEGLEPIYLPPAKNFALTRRCRQRERIVDLLTAQKNRLQALLDWIFPGVMECFSDPYNNVAKMFYRYYSNSCSVAKKTAEELAAHLSVVSAEKVALETAQSLIDCAVKVCALYEGSKRYVDFEENAWEILPEIELLETYQAQLKEVELEIARLYEEVHPQKHIESLSGIGKTLGPALYGVISDPHRFSREKRCRAFMGYVPQQDDSGKTEKKGLKMSQAGPSSARRDLYLAADVARQWDPQLAKIYYNEMVHKGRCHTQAVCAVVPRLIARILRILKDGRDYELRDVNARSVTKKEAKEIIKERYIVPEEVRQRTRNRKKRERFSNMHGAVPENTPNLNRSQNNNNQRVP